MLFLPTLVYFCASQHAKSFLPPGPYDFNHMFGNPPTGQEFDAHGNLWPIGTAFGFALQEATKQMNEANARLLAEHDREVARRERLREARRAERTQARAREEAARRAAEAAVAAAVADKTGFKPPKQVPDVRALVAYPRTQAPAFAFCYDPLAAADGGSGGGDKDASGAAAASEPAGAAAPAGPGVVSLAARMRMGLKAADPVPAAANANANANAEVQAGAASRRRDIAAVTGARAQSYAGSRRSGSSPALLR